MLVDFGQIMPCL